MAKRRRERDRPKGAHNAPYNPNKRVLLSYASDADEDLPEPTPGTGHPGVIDAVSDHYEIQPYLDDEEVESVADENAGAGGANLLRAGPEHGKELVVDTNDTTSVQRKGPSRNTQQSRTNDMTGQRAALGSLSYDWDEGEEEGEEYEGEDGDAEAMAYLRAVRSERQSMPTIFTAPYSDQNEQLYGSGMGDSRGYLSDGTYISRPVLGPTLPQSAKPTVEPQEAYTTALKQRFLRQREQMHDPTCLQSPTSLDKKHPITFRAGDNRDYAQWMGLLTVTVPLPAQLQAMDQGTVSRLIGLVQKVYMQRGKEIVKATSTWIWSLLTRLDDVGTMDNDQVFIIRELGKKAVLVQLSFSEPSTARQLEDVGAHGDKAGTQVHVGESDGEALDGANKQVPNHENALDKVKESPASANTLATLLMIITVVGEVFGQRDLLEFRQQWHKNEDDAQLAA